MAIYFGQEVLSPLRAERQSGVIDTAGVHERGLHVVDVDRETAMSRLKSAFGERLKSRKPFNNKPKSHSDANNFNYFVLHGMPISMVL